jgi:hypothetical protein
VPLNPERQHLLNQKRCLVDGGHLLSAAFRKNPSQSHFPLGTDFESQQEGDPLPPEADNPWFTVTSGVDVEIHPRVTHQLEGYFQFVNVQAEKGRERYQPQHVSCPERFQRQVGHVNQNERDLLLRQEGHPANLAHQQR